jgi:hypothetical protein
MQLYRIIKPKVVYEVLNTEVIAIDFDTGTYYALLHVAKQMWMLIEQEIPFDQSAQILSNYYQKNLNEVLIDLKPFVAELIDKGLIESIDEASHVQGATPQIDSHGWGYEAPKLVSYMDIQELLLLDPIHEVVEAGWPNKG